MMILPIKLQNGHLFVEINGGVWLLDTGAPTSFGESDNITIGEYTMKLANSYMGLTAKKLSAYIGMECSGLIGTDILNKFDHIIDVSGGTHTISSGVLHCTGHELPLTWFMDIPIIQANIKGNDYNLFFDTGAQIGYLQEDIIHSFEPAGIMDDFCPGIGQFQTDTYYVPVALDESTYKLRCGTLPVILGLTLNMAGVSGIIGNQIITDRVIGYFPGRNMLCI